jgi:PAS domain S-box-containing protein
MLGVPPTARYTAREVRIPSKYHYAKSFDRQAMERSTDRSATTAVLVGLTGLIFIADLRFEPGFATWLPYFFLAVPASRLYCRRLFLIAVGGWSLLIPAALLVQIPTENLTTGLFNRTLGIIGLWITAYLLSQHREVGRLRAEGEQRIRTMLDGALDAIITIDTHGIVTTWNRQAEHTFGFLRKEALESPLFRLIIPPACRDAHLKGLRRLLTEEEGPIRSRRLEVTALHKNGHEVPIELTLMPFRIERSTSFCVFARDITERKELETTLRRAREAAEGANQAKSDFLANISHEIRTPLNAICGTADLLLTTTLTPPQRRYAELCAKAGHTLLRLVSDLLDFSRIEAGHIRLDRQPFDVHQAVERTVQLLSHRAEEKGLGLTFRFDPDVPLLIEGDGFRLHQVLLNLIANALKFTEQGQVAVQVTVAHPHEASSRIRLSVIDSGIGIPSEQLEWIFDRFTQVESAADRRHGGVGLGLAICKQLVELMNGRIWAERNAQGGSTFIVDLPLIAVSGSPLPQQQTSDNRSLQPIPPPVPSAPIAQGLRLLLAEDSAESQELMRYYFQGTPHHVDIVSDGAQAVALFKANRFDLVIIDLQMPGMDGFTAARMIRAWEATHQRSPVPILALTANALHDAQEQSLAAGCSGILTKPISRPQLLDALSRYGSTVPAPDSRSKETAAVSDHAARISQDIQRRRPKFLEYRRKDIGAIQEAVARQDYGAIKTMGHRIKGLAGSYGFPDIGAVGQRLEQAAGARDLTAVHREIETLAAILSQTDRAA